MGCASWWFRRGLAGFRGGTDDLQLSAPPTRGGLCHRVALSSICPVAVVPAKAEGRSVVEHLPETAARSRTPQKSNPQNCVAEGLTPLQPVARLSSADKPPQKAPAVWPGAPPSHSTRWATLPSEITDGSCSPQKNRSLVCIPACGPRLRTGAVHRIRSRLADWIGKIGQAAVRPQSALTRGGDNAHHDAVQRKN